MPRPRRFSKKTTYRKKKRTAPSTKRIRRVVKKELHKQLEDKMSLTQLTDANTSGTTLVLTPSTSTLPYVLNLNPTIAQGNNAFTRVGQKIRIRQYKLDIQLVISGASVTAGVDVPMNIYWAVLKVRQDTDTLTASDLNLLFWNGASSNTQFLSGSGYAPLNRLNDEYFHVYAHNFKRPIKLGLENYATGAGGSPASWPNNDYKSNVRFSLNLTKHFSKVCRFTNNTNASTNNNMFMVFYVQKANLDIATVNWDPPAIFPFQTILFEDA